MKLLNNLIPFSQLLNWESFVLFDSIFGIERDDLMIVLYTTPSCTSCRKAKAWFKEQNLTFKERNIFAQPLSAKELIKILKMTTNGTDEIISTRSRIFEKLDLNFDELKLEELLVLIEENPDLLRRPIILDEKRLQVGYNEDDIHQFIPRKERNLAFLEQRKKLVYIDRSIQTMYVFHCFRSSEFSTRIVLLHVALDDSTLELWRVDVLPGFLKICPNHLNFRLLISLFISSCPVLRHNSILQILFAQNIPNKSLRHLFTNDRSFLLIASVTIHV